MADNVEQWRRGWRAKLGRVVYPGEPAWLLKEEINTGDEVVYLTVVSRWEGRWMRRRYTYDVVGEVLHFRGELPVSHDERTKLKSEQLLDLRADPSPGPSPTWELLA